MERALQEQAGPRQGASAPSARTATDAVTMHLDGVSRQYGRGQGAGAIGLALAALVSVAGNAIFRVWLRNMGVTEKMGALFSIPLQLIAGALILAVAVSLLAGAWPSRRAVRLQPLEALRYE